MYQVEAGELVPSSFVADVQDLCRRLRRDVATLSPKESQLLSDIERGDGRYQFRAVKQLLDISKKSGVLATREAFAETMRAHSLGAPVLVSIDDVFDAETRAQAECDVAQLHYTREQSPHNLARAIEAGERQLVLTRTMVDRLRACSAT